MDLTTKTKWHMAINGGLVPILEFPDGQIIYESKVLMDLTEELYQDQGYNLFPKDLYEKAKMRIAIAQVENLGWGYFSAVLNKNYDDAIFDAVKKDLQKWEDFLTSHVKEHPFAWNTPNPTYIDFIIYPSMSRIEMLKGSAYDIIAEKVQFENYPKCNEYIKAIRARPELADAITQTIPYHNHLEAQFKSPVGVKVQLFLPIKYTRE